MGEGARIKITGSSNVVGSNNVINIGGAKPVVKTVVTREGDGYLSEAEKSEVKRLVFDWVDTHNSVKRSPITHQSAWFMLNTRMKVSKYDLIKSVDLEKAIKWLRSKIGAVNAMPSAKTKSPDWRKKRIAAIHTVCKQRGLEQWRLDYMEAKLGKVSLVDCTDDEVERVYKAVMAKR